MFQAGGGGRSRVRVLHVSPDAPAVDIYVDGSKAVSNLSYGQVSQYGELSSGRHNFKVFQTGAGPQGKAVIDADVELSGGQDYTVAAVGTVQNIQPKVLNDTTQAPGRNRAKVRVFHASPDAPAVDVAVPGGPTLFKNLSFGDATQFQEVDAGTVNLDIRPSGTTQSVTSVPNYSLDSGNLYTFVAMGMLKGTPSFRIMPIVDSGRMRTGMGM